MLLHSLQPTLAALGPQPSFLSTEQNCMPEGGAEAAGGEKAAHGPPQKLIPKVALMKAGLVLAETHRRKHRPLQLFSNHISTELHFRDSWCLHCPLTLSGYSPDLRNHLADAGLRSDISF